MIGPFFGLAMRAENRQFAFRIAVALHAMIVAALTFFLGKHPNLLPNLGHGLLVLGIIEGATLIGWRLTQIPKSQSLEFLLVSPVQPGWTFFAEAAVGLVRLAWIGLVGLPMLGALALAGRIFWEDVALLIAIPWTWGAITGIGLTSWAYEPVRFRRVGEIIGLIGILTYLAVGVLAAEKFPQWIQGLPVAWQQMMLRSLVWIHWNNPFGQMLSWFAGDHDARTDWPRIAGLLAATWAVLAVMLCRASARLRGHFHDRHYRPLSEVTPADTRGIGHRPLSWWSVRRVMEYSGRSNLYLAGGFCIVFAAYTIAGSSWPGWLGTDSFRIIEKAGGIPVVACGLVILASVPASFQYGLWDSSVPERCRRLELLLLTELNAWDYWLAAGAAAWKRGRGYLFSAILLWAAAGIAGRAGWGQIAAAGLAAGLFLTLYFSCGFYSFSSGMQANGLGSLLTLGIPTLTFLLYKLEWTTMAAWTPPGSIYSAMADGPSLEWWVGPVLMAILTWAVTAYSLHACDQNLRIWYDKYSGRKSLD